MRRILQIASAIVLSLSCMAVSAAQVHGQTSNACWLAAAKMSDADAVAACYADDAVMWLPGGQVVQGRDAIRKSYASFFHAFTVKTTELMQMDSKSMGDTVVTWGTFRMVMTPKGGGDDVTELGRYTDVSKNVDGMWLYIVDHASDNPTPAN